MININLEEEINRIRLEIYEETKNFTREERTRISNERGQRLAAQYGFKIGTPLKSTAIHETPQTPMEV